MIGRELRTKNRGLVVFGVLILRVEEIKKGTRVVNTG
jgi:hypothetical protein